MARGVKAHLPLDRSGTTTVEYTRDDGAGQLDEGRHGREDGQLSRSVEAEKTTAGDLPVKVKTLTYQGSPANLHFLFFHSAGTGLKGARPARQATRKARSDRRHGEVRYVKARRTPAAAQTVRRGGKTTAGDLPSKLKGRSARNKVRDVFETAWLARQYEHSAQLSGRWTNPAVQDIDVPSSSLQVRCINTRRTTGTAELLRRGGETTASDFTMKAKLVREEEEDGTKTKDRSGGTKLRHPQGQLAPVLQDNAAGREPDDFTGHHPAWVKVGRRRLWRARCSFSPEFKKIRNGRLEMAVRRGSGRLGQQERSVATGSSRLTPLGRGGKTTVCGASETAEPLSQDQKAVGSGQRNAIRTVMART
ncbi:hypothetical protein CF319_g8597 [Tilletia indica]|nr:hypothetical protein CF319_g8597 [Tilletia indica]